MNTFLHDLNDPGLQRCPNCGRLQPECECTEDDMNRWAYGVLYPDECLHHEWEQVWDDGVGQECCVCTICGEYRIFQYETEDDE